MRHVTPLKLGGMAAVCALAIGFSAQQASAQTVITPLYSGGGTLAEKIYRDLFNCWGFNSSDKTPTLGVPQQVSPNCTASPYPIDPNAEILYSPVGSGAGQNAFLGNNATSLGTPSAGTPINWTSGDFPNYPYPALDFAGSDAVLSAAQITQYNTSPAISNATALSVFGPAAQIPTLLTTVAMPFNPSGLNIQETKFPTGGSSGLNLSQGAWCGILTGSITNWSDARLKDDNTSSNLGNGTVLLNSNLPIIVVYREDSSGTTFLASQALIAQCANEVAAANFPTTASTKYFINMQNSQLAALNANGANIIAENFLNGGESGSQGIIDAVNATVGAIGYVSPDYVEPVLPHAEGGPPGANLQNPANTATAGRVGPVVSGTKKFLPPTPAGATAIFANAKAPAVTAPTTGACATANAPTDMAGLVCAAPVTDPNAWTNAASGSVIGNPTSATAYAIGGPTWLELYTCYGQPADFSSGDDPVSALVGSGTNGAVNGFLNWYTTNATVTKEILAQHGFAPLPTTWVTDIRDLLILQSPTVHKITDKVVYTNAKTHKNAFQNFYPPTAIQYGPVSNPIPMQNAAVTPTPSWGLSCSVN